MLDKGMRFSVEGIRYFEAQQLNDKLSGLDGKIHKGNKDQLLGSTNHLRLGVKFSGTRVNQKFTFRLHENSKIGVKMKKVNKTNMVRLAITNKKDFLFRAIEPYIKGEFLVESIGVEGIAYITKVGAYGVVVSSDYGYNLSRSYTGQSFVLELPEYL